MTNSSGVVADKEAGADGAAPYGTRSRNRNGNARPNYAEDKDIEMDNYDYYDKNQGEAPKKSSRLATSTGIANGGETSGRAAAGARKPLTGSAPGSDDSKAVASQVHAGTNSNGHASSGTSAASSVAASRKRKAANGPAQAAQAAVAATTGGQLARRAAISNVAQGSTAAVWPDTNLLSFENCKARPQNGRLVADDGTVLEANGTSWWLHPCAISQHHGGICGHSTAQHRSSIREQKTNELTRSCVPGVRAARRAILPGPHHGIPALAKRPGAAGGRGAHQLVLPSQGYRAQGVGHAAGDCNHAFRH